MQLIDRAYNTPPPQIKVTQYSMFVQGNLIKLSDILKRVKQRPSIRNVLIVAYDLVYFDVEFRVPGVNLAIISPGCETQINSCIDLSGLDGEATQQSNEKDGLPGKPGQDSGHFFYVSYGIDQLPKINLCGGSGSEGGRGKDGKNGQNGWENDLTYNRAQLIKFDDRECIFVQSGEAGEIGENSGCGGNGGFQGQQGVFCALDLATGQLITELQSVNQKEGKKGEDGQAGKPGIGGAFALDIEYKYSLLYRQQQDLSNKQSNIRMLDGLSLDAKNSENQALPTNNNFKQFYREVQKLSQIYVDGLQQSQLSFYHKVMAIKTSNQSMRQDVLQGYFSGYGTQECKASDIDPYFNYEIDHILQSRLSHQDLNSTKIMKSEMINSESSAKCLLENIIYNLSEQNKRIALPLNLSGLHWVALIMINQDNKITLNYIDSENNPISQMLQDAMKELSTEITAQRIQTKQQKYNNCGSEVIENIMLYLCGFRRSQKEAIEFNKTITQSLHQNNIKEILKYKEISNYTKVSNLFYLADNQSSQNNSSINLKMFEATVAQKENQATTKNFAYFI